MKTIKCQAKLKIKVLKKLLIIIKEARYNKKYKVCSLNYIKTSYSGANIQDFERLENAWKDIRIQIQNGTIDYEEANNAIKKLTNSNKDYETSAKKASTATNSLGDRLKKAFQYFTFYDALQMGKTV